MPRLGYAVALVAALLDRASKWLLLDVWPVPVGGVEVSSFLNLVMAWNRGVSFGLLDRDWPGLPWLLSGLAVAIVVALIVWLRRVEERRLAVAIGLIVGGAVSNVIDRLVYGAVADFLDFHVAGYHWPAFNLADSCIVAGVALLLLDSLFTGRESAKNSE